MSSPLGSADEVAAIREQHPDLAPLIGDLEAIIGPDFTRSGDKAQAAQDKVKRSRSVALIGTAIAAVASVLQVIPSDWVQIPAKFAVLIAGVVAAGAVATRRERHFKDWTKNRRVAEELRSLYFRELAVADVAADPEARRHALDTKLVAVLDGATVDVAAALVAPSGPALPEDRVALYNRHRLTDQIDWMTGKAEANRKAASRLDGAQSALVLAIPLLSAIGLLSGLSEGDESQIPEAAVATAIVSGAATAIGAASTSLGHDRLAAHYERTVADLERHRRRWRLGTPNEGLVEQIEHTLMREHRTWHQLTEDIEQAGSG